MIVRLHNCFSEDNMLRKIEIIGQSAQLITVENGEAISGVPVMPLDILKPTIRIAYAGVPSFNYAYIDELNRFYFITDKVCTSEGIWEFSFSVDVLMTYYNKIIVLDGFVTRSESLFNKMLPDSNYNQNLVTKSHVTGASLITGKWQPITDRNVTTPEYSEHFIVALNSTFYSYLVNGVQNSRYGVVYSHSPELGPLYYNYLMNALQQTDKFFNTGLASADVFREFYYMPVGRPNASVQLNHLNFKTGYLDAILSEYTTLNFEVDFVEKLSNVTLMCESEDGYPYKVNTQWLLNIYDPDPDREQGEFLRSSPYSRWVLNFPPFADTEIDPSLFIKDDGTYYNYMLITLQTDFHSGDSLLFVAHADYYDGSTVTGVGDFYQIASANVKVQLPTIKANRDDSLGNSLIKAGSGAATAIAGGVAGSALAAIGGIVSAVTGVAESVTKGYSYATGAAQGSCLMADRPRLYTYWSEYSGGSGSATYGRPLMEFTELHPKYFSGMVYADGIHMNGLIEALPAEKQMIEDLFKQGVFYNEVY